MEKLENQYYIYQTIDYSIDNIIELLDSVLVFAVFDASLLLQGNAMTLKNRTLSIWKKQWMVQNYLLINPPLSNKITEGKNPLYPFFIKISWCMS
ncbi:hypothetical protein ACG9YX_15250 [Acinetobacter nematophilus]|uniref:hypothetical protein n=1 Tax=Acinetobacter nematophilus TaxID=2994642 RepID=UPI003AF88C9A